jgi:hypothetical protein
MSEAKDVAGCTRRAALGVGLASMAAAAAVSSPSMAANKPRREPARFKDPVWNREATARLEGDITGKATHGYVSGVICGVRDEEALRHLLGFEVFSSNRLLRQPDGSYWRLRKELVFYTDPVTGVPLDEWDNPYSGERVRVVDIANDPFNLVISDYVRTPVPVGDDPRKAPEPAVKKPFLRNWKEFGSDTVVLSIDYHAMYPNLLDPDKWPRESAGKLVRTSELFRWCMRREDLEDPSKTHVPHTGSWVRITPWLPWMLMGKAPGHIIYDGIFRTIDSLDTLPAAVLDRVKTRYPQYLTAATEWYGPNYSSLENYTRQQKPAPPR